MMSSFSFTGVILSGLLELERGMLKGMVQQGAKNITEIYRNFSLS